MINQNMSMEQWLHYWYDTYAKRNIKQSTAISYNGYINNHIIPQIGTIKLSELNSDILQGFFNYLMEFGNKKTSSCLSPKTLHNIKLMLHKSLKKAYALDLIKQNYIDLIELPKMSKPKIRVLSDSEHCSLISELQRTDEKLYFGVYLSIVTGMRLGEVLGLRWSDVDLDNNVLYIERTVNRLNTLEDDTTVPKTELVVGTPKSECSIRSIPFTPEIHNEFVIYKEKQQERLGKKQIRSSDYILMLRKGYPVEPKTMQDVLKRLECASGIKKINFHALRHTFATRAIEKGIDPKTLSVILGHSDVSVTLNRYTHISDEQKRRAMDKMFRKSDSI